MIPPRDWRRWWYGYIGHFLLGVLTAVMLITDWTMTGLGFLLAYVAYQGFSYLRKKDTPGRDVGDFMAGLIPAAVAGWLYLEAWPVVAAWF